ncbi:MAG: aminotransferase class IV, partial [Micromonosporaceae bacterium]
PELDWRAGERMVRPAELQAADGVWLVSSVRGVTAVRELDGAALTVSPQHKALQELAGFDT